MAIAAQLQQCCNARVGLKKYKQHFCGLYLISIKHHTNGDFVASHFYVSVRHFKWFLFFNHFKAFRVRVSEAVLSFSLVYSEGSDSICLITFFGVKAFSNSAAANAEQAKFGELWVQIRHSSGFIDLQVSGGICVFV